ncbi:hypothetical protein [Nocardia sp. NPDC057440]|uniref:hypothetical protein n=1 Tax=Nocardia sp. NPDC057440 TaxID=3346134 RepID=UPI00366C8B8D
MTQKARATAQPSRKLSTIQRLQTPPESPATAQLDGKEAQPNTDRRSAIDDDGGLLGQISAMYAADNARMERESSHRREGHRMSDRDQLAALIDEHSFQAPSYSEDAAEAVLAAGWRPPPRVIETAEDLASLPAGSILVDFEGDAWQLMSGGWRCPALESAWSDDVHFDAADAIGCAPLTVLHTPEIGGES